MTVVCAPYSVLYAVRPRQWSGDLAKPWAVDELESLQIKLIIRSPTSSPWIDITHPDDIRELIELAKSKLDDPQWSISLLYVPLAEREVFMFKMRWF